MTGAYSTEKVVGVLIPPQLLTVLSYSMSHLQSGTVFSSLGMRNNETPGMKAKEEVLPLPFGSSAGIRIK